MKKITYNQMVKVFREAEKNMKHLNGVIVFTSTSFIDKNGDIVPYSLDSRSYSVSSDNKAFIPGQIGSSVFASCLDGTDQGVRVDWYMKDMYGGDKGWTVDYCYLIENQ